MKAVVEWGSGSHDRRSSDSMRPVCDGHYRLKYVLTALSPNDHSTRFCSQNQVSWDGIAFREAKAGSTVSSIVFLEEKYPG